METAIEISLVVEQSYNSFNNALAKTGNRKVCSHSNVVGGAEVVCYGKRGHFMARRYDKVGASAKA